MITPPFSFFQKERRREKQMAGPINGPDGLFSDDSKLMIAALESLEQNLQPILEEIKESITEVKDSVNEVKDVLVEIKELLAEE